MVAIDQADALDLGAFFEHGGRAFDLQVLDQNNRIAIGQRVAIGVLDDAARFFALVSGGGGGPLVATVWADKITAIGVGVFKCALGAGGEIGPGLLFLKMFWRTENGTAMAGAWIATAFGLAMTT